MVCQVLTNVNSNTLLFGYNNSTHHGVMLGTHLGVLVYVTLCISSSVVIPDYNPVLLVVL